MGQLASCVICQIAIMNALVLVFCAAVVAVLAQQPHPCETPPQWEGKFIRMDESKNFTQFAKISYDYTNKRVREIEFLEEGSNKTAYDVLYLHHVSPDPPLHGVRHP